MGKGKGPVNKWVCLTKSGQIIYELKGVPFGLAKHAVRAAVKKLPLSGFIVKQIY